MISPECFTKKWIGHLREIYTRTDPILLEKTIYAFELLGLLSRSDRSFVFKSGTSVMLHVQDLERLSIDIDIIGQFMLSEFESMFKGSVFTRVEEYIGIHENIPIRHFAFYYSSKFPQRNQYVLLDVLEVENPYTTLVEKPIQIELFRLGDRFTVNTPMLDGLLGDKLTAFAPDTIGIPYSADRSMEIIKQLYDVGKLFDHATDFNELQSNYKNLFELGSGFLNNRFKYEDVLEDTIQTGYLICQLDLRSSVENDKTNELRRGIKQIQSHLLNTRFSLYEAKIAASKAAFLANAMKGSSSINPFQFRFNHEKIPELQDAGIEGRFEVLNRLKAILPGAFYYWHFISKWKSA
jgi:hypothetical protein